MVIVEQAKEHAGQHTYGADKEYRRSKAGRKTKWGQGLNKVK